MARPVGVDRPCLDVVRCCTLRVDVGLSIGRTGVPGIKNDDRESQAMTHTELLFRDEARTKLLRGTTALADAVRGTLGPESRSVLMEKKYGTPVVCDDGVTIVKRVQLKDPVENMGARLLADAAIQTGDKVGDGTTTSTLLANSIFADGQRNVFIGASATEIRIGLNRGLAIAVEAIRAASRPVKDR
jgi:chaperonin GroEL